MYFELIASIDRYFCADERRERNPSMIGYKGRVAGGSGVTQREERS